MALVLGICLSSAGPVLAAGDTAGRATAPGFSVQSQVVLKDSRTPLRDGDRALPNRGECLFRIARLGPDMADIVTEDGTVRGWVNIAEILPLETAADHFSRRIAAAPGDSEAYQMRGRIWIEKEEWDRALADLDEALAAGPGRPAEPPPAGPDPGPEEGAREGHRRVLRAPFDWTRRSPSPTGTGGSPGTPGGSSTRRSPT